VTVCGRFQLAAVNVRPSGETVPSSGSLDARRIVTSAAGGVSRTTLNAAAPPPSVVTRPEIGLTVIPAVSSSVLTTATSTAASAAYFSSPLVTGPTWIV